MHSCPRAGVNCPGRGGYEKGTEGSIRKTLRCKERGALKARSEKRYGAKKEESRLMGQKPCPVEALKLHNCGRFAITTSLHHYITTSQHHNMTTSQHQNIATSQHHYIAASLHQNIRKSLHDTSQHHYITTSLHHNIAPS